ncbi:hypothetical protein [Photobacterium sp. R1]
MTQKVLIYGNKWNLEDIKDNVDWEKHQDWIFKKYCEQDEHEHCLICYWTIFHKIDEESGFGYYYGGSTWLCNECYEQFITPQRLRT